MSDSSFGPTFIEFFTGFVVTLSFGWTLIECSRWVKKSLRPPEKKEKFDGTAYLMVEQSFIMNQNIVKKQDEIIVLLNQSIQPTPLLRNNSNTILTSTPLGFQHYYVNTGGSGGSSNHNSDHETVIYIGDDSTYNNHNNNNNTNIVSNRNTLRSKKAKKRKSITNTTATITTTTTPRSFDVQDEEKDYNNSSENYVYKEEEEEVRGGSGVSTNDE